MADLKTFQDQVKQGDLQSVRAALAADPSLLDAPNEAGQTAFLLAKYYRQNEVADFLLRLKPKLNRFDACVAGQTEVVLEEVDRDPAFLDACSPDGWTPLHLAAFFGHTELVKGLLNRSAAVDARSTNQLANTPLHAAAAGRSLATMKLLLENGANPNARQSGGWSALHSAAQTGSLEMAQLLLAHGADVQARADNNQSPLDMAMVHGHLPMTMLLEESGAQLQ